MSTIVITIKHTFGTNAIGNNEIKVTYKATYKVTYKATYILHILLVSSTKHRAVW